MSSKNIWQVGGVLVASYPTALLHDGFCSFVSGQAGDNSSGCSAAPIAGGSCYPMPAPKQPCSCDET